MDPFVLLEKGIPYSVLRREIVLTRLVKDGQLCEHEIKIAHKHNSSDVLRIATLMNRPIEGLVTQ